MRPEPSGRGFLFGRGHRSNPGLTPAIRPARLSFDFNQTKSNKSEKSNMARGGKRDGAGRKSGSATTKTREIADQAAAEGVTPLEYMLGVLRDATADVQRRDDMAKAAAPYIHARLASVEHGGKDGGPITVKIVD